MNFETQLLFALQETGVAMSSAILILCASTGLRVVRLEKQMRVMVEHVQGCPHNKKRPLAMPLLIALAILAAIALQGCATGFSFGFDVRVPGGTNGPSVVITNATIAL